MSDEDAFLAAIKAAPGDDAPRLIFADWLDERGDPRGAWLRDPVIRRYLFPWGQNPAARLLSEWDGVDPEIESALVRVGAPAVPDLLAALRTQPAYHRANYVRVLTALADDLAAFRPQLEAEAASPDPGVRTAALTALACLRDADAFAPLIARLASPDPAAAAEALQAVGDLGEAAAPVVPHVLRLWRREAEARTGTAFRAAAIRALGRVSHPDAVPVLVGALAHPVLAPLVPDALDGYDESGPLLIRALATLDQAGARLALDALFRATGAPDEQLVEALAAADTPERTRLALLSAVDEGRTGSAGPPADVAGAVRDQLDHASPAVRRAAAEVLGGRWDADAALPALERAARDRDPGVRAAAVGAVARVGRTADPSRTLRRALADEEAGVRAAAWDAYLAIHNFPLLIRDVGELLRRDDPEVRVCAAEALGRVLAYEINLIDDRVTTARADAAGLLLELLRDESRAVRKAAATVLAERLPQFTEGAAEALVPALGDSSAVVREKAARAFARLETRTEPAVRACFKLLNDEDVGVIGAALAALGVMRKGRPDIDRRIIPFLRDRSPRVRAEAAVALTTWDGPADDLVEDALDLIADRDAAPRAAGLRLLASLAYPFDFPGDRLAKHLRRGAADAAVEVRRAAAAGMQWADRLGLAPFAADLVRLLETESDEEILEAARQYLRYSCPTKVEVLAPLLDHPSPTVRGRALELLPGAGPAALPVVDKLLAELARDLPETRLAAVRALVGVGPAAAPAIPAVVRMLEGGVPDEVYEACGVAATLGPAGVPLVAVLDARRRDPGAPHHESLTHALASLAPHCPEAVPLVRDLLRTARGDLLRQVLFALADAKAGAAPFLAELLPLLARDDETLEWAARVLGAIGPAAAPAVPALIERLDPGQAWTVRQAAAGVLGAIGEGAAAAVPALRQVCDGKEAGSHFDQLRRVAVEALGKIGGDGGLPQIRKALFGADPWGREEAAQALVPLGPAARPALPDVCRALLDRKWDGCQEVLTEAGLDRRTYLLDALEAMKTTDGPVLPTLQKVLDDPNDALRERAAEVLAALGPAAHPVLQRALKHRDEGVREVARRALGS